MRGQSGGAAPHIAFARSIRCWRICLWGVCLRQPPLSYLADRVLASWTEDEAWAMESEPGLGHLLGVLRLGVVNVDRVRLRSWFVWLLALSRAPGAALMVAWLREVRAAGGLRLRHEAALLRALAASETTESHRGRLSPDGTPSTFAALAAIVSISSTPPPLWR